MLAALLLIRATSADVLPDDRADLFYSKYSGGGMDITGESVLVRKKFTENFAVEANYFVDKVSGASIDVLSQASQIKDERKQKSAHRRIRPRQDHVHASLHQQHGARLHVQHHELFAETGHVRRPDHPDAGLHAYQRQVGENNGTPCARHRLAGARRRAAATTSGCRRSSPRI